MNFRRMRNALAVLVIAVAASSCTLFSQPVQQPPPAPATYQQSLAYGYAQLAASYNLLADLTERRRITLADAQKTLTQLDELRAALDTASAVNDPARVQTVTQGLIAIETALRARVERQK